MSKKGERPASRSPTRERDRRRADFAATVSHDLKTPLNAIVGFLSVLMQDTPLMRPEWVEYLGQIDRGARQLLSRINDLLELYRLEAGKIPLKPVWLNPGEILSQAAEAAQEALERNRNQLLLEAPRVRLFCEPRLMLRVARELLVNAAQATRDGVVRATLSCQDRGGGNTRRVSLSVEDSGNSLTSERLDILTRTLATDPASEEARWDGIGLGLALARQAANLLGGRLAIEARPDGGTRAILAFDLPGKQVEDEPAA
ncbi:MAG: HAMP domain-containing histidine kinase [Myxococcales bacterium]|nr:HAMP domain-containing histidine kinase [Myxococcales bacterium]